jgi:hypothetical protein
MQVLTPYSALLRDSDMTLKGMNRAIGRTPEAGSRTLVHPASAGPESHGKFMSDCKVAEPSPFVRSEDGIIVQTRFWDELTKKLEAIKPGVTKNL